MIREKPQWLFTMNKSDPPYTIPETNLNHKKVSIYMYHYIINQEWG